VVVAFRMGEAGVAGDAAVALDAVEVVTKVFSGWLLVEWGFVEVGVVVMAEVLVGFVCGSTGECGVSAVVVVFGSIAVDAGISLVS